MKNEVGLPVKEFYYTLDQIAYLLDVTEKHLRESLVHFHGRSVGTCPKGKMLAVDISPDTAKRPDWRVAEKHLKRWMRFRGIKIYDRGYVI